MPMVYDFATTTPVGELHFILEAAELNKKAAEVSLRGDYGHKLGKMIFLQPHEQFFGNGIYSKILAYTGRRQRCCAAESRSWDHRWGCCNILL